MSGNDSGNGTGAGDPGHEARPTVGIEPHGLKLLAAAQGAFWGLLEAGLEELELDLAARGDEGAR